MHRQVGGWCEAEKRVVTTYEDRGPASTRLQHERQGTQATVTARDPAVTSDVDRGRLAATV